MSIPVDPHSVAENCTLGDIRLVNGSSEREGRVEVCFGDLWTSVCDSGWDNREAGVVCRELFDSTLGMVVLQANIMCLQFVYIDLIIYYISFGPSVCAGGLAIVNSTQYGIGDGPAVLSYLGCDGTEEYLAECSSVSAYSDMCNTAAVQCNGKLMTPIV